MSVQTGIETPSGPASRRIGDRVRYRMDLFASQPNPLWVREMRQSARLLRTPIILMALTVIVVLLMAAVGGVMTGSNSPAEAGSALFHVYFSLAWFVVTLVGPALAANSIASEREGKTWEAVLLTGMRPAEVTRGKFLSAYTAISMYVVMLAPCGALPFLFGGVTPIEVLVAFVFLFLIALLSVAFGLAISAKMQSLRAALLVTLLVAAPLSAFCFFAFGVGGSALVHELWDAVEAGPPVWLPTAYGRAPFGVEYVIYLIALPAAAVGLPAWLLYEVTRANLTSVTEDRSFGLKKWFLVASIVTLATGLIPLFAVTARNRAEAVIFGMCLVGMFVMFNAFLFGGEAIGPSRRVRKMLLDKGVFRRMLSPGVMRAANLQVAMAMFAIAVLAGVGVAYISAQGGPYATLHTEQTLTFGAYAVAFSTFVIGLAAFLRSRSQSSSAPRVLLLVVLFFLFTGPWIIAALSGVLAGASSGRFDMALAVAAPSPFYMVIALEALGRPDPGVAVIAALSTAGAYAIGGFAFLVAARVRTKKIIDDHEAILVEADRRLAEEDALAAELGFAGREEDGEPDDLRDLEQPAEGADEHSARVEPTASETHAVAAEAKPSASREPAPDADDKTDATADGALAASPTADAPTADAPVADAPVAETAVEASEPVEAIAPQPVIEIGTTSDDDA